MAICERCDGPMQLIPAPGGIAANCVICGHILYKSDAEAPPPDMSPIKMWGKVKRARAIYFLHFVRGYDITWIYQRYDYDDLAMLLADVERARKIKDEGASYG